MENIQKDLVRIFSNSCYALCLNKKFNESDDLNDWIICIFTAIKKYFIDKECYVEKPLKFIEMISGEKFKDVEKIYISDLDDLPNDDEIYIVEYKLSPTDKGSHFVCVQNRKIIFDPSGNSITVQFGKPYSWRKFIK